MGTRRRPHRSASAQRGALIPRYGQGPRYPMSTRGTTIRASSAASGERP
jgi:hypothetical protein